MKSHETTRESDGARVKYRDPDNVIDALKKLTNVRDRKRTEPMPSGAQATD
jgi:hypothetical protein